MFIFAAPIFYKKRVNTGIFMSNSTLEVLQPYSVNTLKTLRELSFTVGKQLSHSEYRILMCLVHHRNSITYQCNPGMKRIGVETGCSSGTVSNGIAKLSKLEFIIVTKRFDEYNGSALSSQYWICHDIDKIHGCFDDEEAAGTFANHFPNVEEWYDKAFGGTS